MDYLQVFEGFLFYKTEGDQSGATGTVIIPLYTWDLSMFQIKKLYIAAH